MRALLCWMWFCLATELHCAEPVQFRSGTNQTSLLELYTSEGCGSCPPADAWLSKLRASPRLWKEFVPVAYHVDYWDYLGWKDPFGSKEFSQRQRDQAARWPRGSVYTPGFVLDGQEWRGWFQRDELPAVSRKAVGTLTVGSEDGQRWSLRFDPVGTDPPASIDFHAVLLGFDLRSDVKAGENRGRLLQHDFVALTKATASAKRNEGFFQGSVSLPVPSASTSNRLALAVWVTPASQLQPLQAVGGWVVTNR